MIKMLRHHKARQRLQDRRAHWQGVRTRLMVLCFLILGLMLVWGLRL